MENAEIRGSAMAVTLQMHRLADVMGLLQVGSYALMRQPGERFTLGTQNGKPQSKPIRQRRNMRYVRYIYPPRVCARARKRSLKGGWSVELKDEDPVTRRSWDFRKMADRNRAKHLVIHGKPELLILSPPCTLFSNLPNNVMQWTPNGSVSRVVVRGNHVR